MTFLLPPGIKELKIPEVRKEPALTYAFSLNEIRKLRVKKKNLGQRNVLKERTLLRTYKNFAQEL